MTIWNSLTSETDKEGETFNRGFTYDFQLLSDANTRAGTYFIIYKPRKRSIDTRVRICKSA